MRGEKTLPAARSTTSQDRGRRDRCQGKRGATGLVQVRSQGEKLCPRRHREPGLRAPSQKALFDGSGRHLFYFPQVLLSPPARVPRDQSLLQTRRGGTPGRHGTSRAISSLGWGEPHLATASPSSEMQKCWSFTTLLGPGVQADRWHLSPFLFHSERAIVGLPWWRSG